MMSLKLVLLFLVADRALSACLSGDEVECMQQIDSATLLQVKSNNILVKDAGGASEEEDDDRDEDDFVEEGIDEEFEENELLEQDSLLMTEADEELNEEESEETREIEEEMQRNMKKASSRPTPPPEIVVGQPYLCSTPSGKTFHERFCYCPGDIYYGRRYVSGKPGSGEELTFEQMTEGGCKHYKEDKWQPDGCKVKRYDELKTSRRRPGFRYSLCGGCISFWDRGFWKGYSKQCYCNPLHVPPPTTTTTPYDFGEPDDGPPPPPPGPGGMGGWR